MCDFLSRKYIAYTLSPPIALEQRSVETEELTSVSISVIIPPALLDLKISLMFLVVLSIKSLGLNFKSSVFSFEI